MRKKKNLFILIAIVVIIVLIAIVLYYFVPGTKKFIENSHFIHGDTNTKDNYDNFNGLFDDSTPVSGNISSGAIMENDMAMMVSYLENVGDYREGIFPLKNKYSHDLSIDKGNFDISFRGYPTAEENVFVINSEEELKEYFDVEIVEPSHPVILKKDESFNIKIKMTLKKNVPGKVVIGSINIHLKDIEKSS